MPEDTSTGELRAVEDWAKALGEYHDTKGVIGQESYYSARHTAAATLHGWDAHAHHEGSSMQLTRADYLAALDASHPEEGNPMPHPPAVSKHSPIASST